MVIDFDQKEFESLIAMESKLLKLYEVTTTVTDKPLIPGICYRMIDPEGKSRTISKHTRWQRMKYHFENTNFCPCLYSRLMN